ncbi:hypothetical protein JJV70_10120 [Streptomyces sp. JJ66]|uniref:hypothetical protein n=1 Tax=Streptomyces sp. JJ66 TaxID=2803843 RepID=UPI001C569D20|nr:hypothetical protein [Streptomyces sp. JJ66]MBW1602459.1 hypothetical protein [Streptomyces sp. JJ66]
MRGGRTRQRAVLSAIGLLLPALLMTGQTATAAGAPASEAATARAATGQSDTWQADLTQVDADDVNVQHTGGALRVHDDGLSPASLGTGRGYGSQTLPEHRTRSTVTRVTADVDAQVPPGAELDVDVRGLTPDGSWSEWREATSGEAVTLPSAATAVQARLTLHHAKDGPGPAVHGLSFTADAAGTPPEVPRSELDAQQAPLTARVFATREGLVGHTTANGHVIQPNDHFVALPSRRALSPKGSHQYAVRVCGPARCETAPVWDVGPWNTRDDYWNPSSQRQEWKDLPRGVPEAQAAYQDGYNGGRDQYGRKVSNPAGIDLADGTFANVGLRGNGWVTVTYLWTDGGDTTPFPTWGTDVRIRQQATTKSAVVATLPRPTTVRVRCQKRGELVRYREWENDAWSYLPDYGGYISNIFIDVKEAWLPGVPRC